MPLTERIQSKKIYELAYLLPANFELEEVAKNLDALKAKLKELAYEIITEPQPQKRRLAFLIKKQNQAYFGFLRFTGMSDQIKPLEKTLKLNANILRYMIFSITAKQIEEEEKMAKQIKREVIRRHQISAAQSQPVKETPQEIKPEEFEEKMKEIEKVLE